jgi:GWxTD domain-containing protein
MHTRFPFARQAPWFAGLLISGLAAAQPAEFRYSKEGDLPSFYQDTAVFAASDSGRGRVWCFVKIPYDELQFVREGEAYRARYELSVVCFDPKGNPSATIVRTKTLDAPRFEVTNSRSMASTESVSFDVLPGDYRLHVSLMDFDSKKAAIKKLPIQVPVRSATAIGTSDLVLADRVEADSSGGMVPVPSVTGNFADGQDTLFLWFELYTPSSMQHVPLGVRLLDQNGKMLREETFDQKTAGTKTLCTIPVPKGDLKGGRYRLELTAGEGTQAAKRLKSISVHWMGMPSQTSDLDQAIEQLRYVAKSGDIKKMKKLQGEQKMTAFRDFWSRMDPTPETEINELMEEYYRRVDFANQNYSGFQEGWKSDRGMVYILLGAPSEVERHPFESDSRPYEIWTYESINRYFVFVDRTGLGDYRLEGPFWDVLNQVR